MFCPACKTEWARGMSECPVCSKEFPSDPADSPDANWVLLGYVGDPMSADYAREVLKSYEVPAVVISKSGFFGRAGLTLQSFYSPGAQLFEVSVPSDYLEEAAGIMDMILGDKWQKKE